MKFADGFQTTGPSIVITPAAAPLGASNEQRAAVVPLTPNGDGQFSAGVTLGAGPASRTLDMIIDTGAAVSGVPAGVANALIAAKQPVELPKRLLTLANGARENERTIGIITVTVGHYVAHHAVAAVTNGTPLLGLPVLRQIGRFTVDAAHEQLILNESTQCETPSEAALKEVDEASLVLEAWDSSDALNSLFPRLTEDFLKEKVRARVDSLKMRNDASHAESTKATQPSAELSPSEAAPASREPPAAEAQAQVKDIMKAPMDSSKAPAPPEREPS